MQRQILPRGYPTSRLVKELRRPTIIAKVDSRAYRRARVSLFKNGVVDENGYTARKLSTH
jgi:hypothetical protein